MRIHPAWFGLLGVLVISGCSGGGGASNATTAGGLGTESVAFAPSVVRYPGNIYAQTNSATGNAVVHFGRSSDGVLHYLDQASTGGKGSGPVSLVSLAPSGDPLASAHSVVIQANHQRVFTVNAASNSVSSIDISPSGSVRLIGTYPTGGLTPTSIALYGSLLYVSHSQAGVNNVQLTGFKVQDNGTLKPISGAQYATTGATNIPEVLFSPDGSLLAMTELGTGNVVIRPVNSDGTLGAPVVTKSLGAGPFALQFLDQHHLVVSEAGGGSLSSYGVDSAGHLTPVSKSVPDGQTAPCWLRESPNGKYLFVANPGSGDVSVYTIGADGSIALLHPIEAFLASQSTSLPNGNVDAVISDDGQYYYQEMSGLGLVAAYHIASDGSLVALPNANGSSPLAAGAQGQDGY